MSPVWGGPAMKRSSGGVHQELAFDGGDKLFCLFSSRYWLKITYETAFLYSFFGADTFVWNWICLIRHDCLIFNIIVLFVFYRLG